MGVGTAEHNAPESWIFESPLVTVFTIRRMVGRAAWTVFG